MCPLNGMDYQCMASPRTIPKGMVKIHRRFGLYGSPTFFFRFGPYCTLPSVGNCRAKEPSVGFGVCRWISSRLHLDRIYPVSIVDSNTVSVGATLPHLAPSQITFCQCYLQLRLRFQLMYLSTFRCPTVHPSSRVPN
jgi:hypothetical protein